MLAVCYVAIILRENGDDHHFIALQLPKPALPKKKKNTKKKRRRSKDDGSEETDSEDSDGSGVIEVMRKMFWAKQSPKAKDEESEERDVYFGSLVGSFEESICSIEEIMEDIIFSV